MLLMLHIRVRMPSFLEKGFTLLELLVIMSAIAILAAIATQAFSTYIQKARVARAIVEIRGLEGDIRNFVGENYRLPMGLNELRRGSLLDPWGTPYQYLNIANGEIKGKGSLRKDRNLVPINSDYDLYSMGADGQSLPPLTAKPSQDDIIRANNGAYIGLASLY
ncbi:type II secretion system major pseudopilin ChrG [Geotalea daltonii FRC-32]|uniref:Type II secretion system major pseudopilin ChrG n=1 Tax=Geotalea daltonii (strain DSM 22248 / JCM 15807 / FRC-32) TaxID=316067 RepID=B9M323_GEODF|nr:prepilin-type N-terminal cleavage/methylation domain-containing protein [Geotalea daltonii]ACM19433.1 type II secretion system major pseudopilin ChrG [Geotalea daltonii FRC-32]